MNSPISSTLSDENRKVAADALQNVLVDVIDLSLIGKQAHWNVVGSQFRSIHLDLDELVTTAREFTDQVAERLTAIGVSPDGRVATVARDSGTKASATAGARTPRSSLRSSVISQLSSRGCVRVSRPPAMPTRSRRIC